VAADLDGKGEQSWLLPWPPAPSRRILSDLPLFGPTPQLSWMPDSRHVLFAATTDSSNPSRLLMGDIDTGRFWPVLTETRAVRWPSVSPDGTKAVFNSGLGHYDVVEVPLDGGPVRTLLGSLRDESMPAFSSVGRTLVYVTDRGGGSEVWMESLAEHWARPLLSPSDFRMPSGPVYWFMTPVLSPDAQRVALVAINVAGSRLWITGVAGSAPVRITTDEESEYAPSWSPDGQWIVYRKYANDRPTLAKIRVGASQPSIDLLQDLSTIAALPEWSPTGEWIACAVTNKPGITLVSPEGKNTRFLPGVFAPHAWSRDGKTIYQVRGTNNCSLVAVDIATGKERVIRELGDLQPASGLSPGLRITVAPDGKSIAWAVDRSRSELWILDGLRTARPWFQRLLGKLP
jgi:Tol biopolymer transport system component